MIKRLTRRSWPFFIYLADIAAFIVLGAFIYWVVLILFDSTTSIGDKRSLVIGSSGLVLSMLTVYVSTIRPFFRKPRLEISFDKQWSDATLENDTGSWFYRIRVENYGLTRAESCVGRLIDVWTETGEQLAKFDPLPLFWSKQSVIMSNNNDVVTYKPIDIQGFRDFDFLDLAQVKNDLLTLRVVILPPITLKIEPETSLSPGNKPILKLPGTYYVRLGIYSGDVHVSPFLIKIACSEISLPLNSRESPCTLNRVKKIGG